MSFKRDNLDFRATVLYLICCVYFFQRLIYLKASINLMGKKSIGIKYLCS